MDTDISPELVLVDQELRAFVIAEFQAAVSHDPSLLEWTPPRRAPDLDAHCVSSDDDDEFRGGFGPTPLLIAAAIYFVASLAEILFFGALAGASLALLVSTLFWI